MNYFEMIKIFFQSQNIWVGLSTIGVFAGLIVLPIAKLFRLNFIVYLGCLFTGRSSGILNFFAGSIAYIFVCMFSVYLYVLLYVVSLKIVPVFLTGYDFTSLMHVPIFIVFSFFHTLCSAIMISLFDVIHPCVRNGTLQSIGFKGMRHNPQLLFAFIFVHACYALICFKAFGLMYH